MMILLRNSIPRCIRVFRRCWWIRGGRRGGFFVGRNKLQSPVSRTEFFGLRWETTIISGWFRRSYNWLFHGVVKRICSSMNRGKESANIGVVMSKRRRTIRRRWIRQQRNTISRGPCFACRQRSHRGSLSAACFTRKMNH